MNEEAPVTRPLLETHSVRQFKTITCVTPQHQQQPGLSPQALSDPISQSFEQGVKCQFYIGSLLVSARRGNLCVSAIWSSAWNREMTACNVIGVHGWAGEQALSLYLVGSFLELTVFLSDLTKELL